MRTAITSFTQGAVVALLAAIALAAAWAPAPARGEGGAPITVPALYGVYARTPSGQLVDVTAEPVDPRNPEPSPAATVPTVPTGSTVVIFDKLVASGLINFPPGGGSIRLERVTGAEARERGVPVRFRLGPVAASQEMLELVPARPLRAGGYVVRSEAERSGIPLARFTVVGETIVDPETAKEEAEMERHARRGRIGSNEAMAIGALRTLCTAQALFREGDKDRDGVLDYATSLQEIARVSLIDAALGAGKKGGYAFAILAADQFTYSITADPLEPGLTGDRHFFMDESGVIRFSTTGRATSESTAIGG